MVGLEGKDSDRRKEATMSKKSDTKAHLCIYCGQPIAPARLEALPGVTTCIECAKKHPAKFDPSTVELSEASPINRNGFAPSD
jgi:RNA polymerase-binding transcription factor DksA